MAADIRTDLSELRPAKGPGDPSGMLIGWPDLEEYARHPVGEPDARVRMLGYMMDGYQTYPDGAQLQMFILMPEAGQFLHPAHRVPNEMVEVWLGQPVPFKFRALVWVSGILQRTGNSPRDEKASWAMRDAETERAEQREITRWFAP